MKRISNKFKYGIAALAIAMLGFTQVKTEEPVYQNSLFVEPCEVDYTEFNAVTCTAWVKINGVEYTAYIDSVDYSLLNDVNVEYVLDQYPDVQTEKAIYEELRAYFDDRRTFWIKGV